MPTAAENENNSLVLTALFKQIDVARTYTINFKCLAEDIPVNGENAARHRWDRCKKSFNKTPGTPQTAAEIKNNNMVLTALVKQIEVGRVDFKRLAEDIPVNGENAARHRWKRMLDSLGIKNRNGKDRYDSKEGDEVASSPVKAEANTKIVRKKLVGSPLKNEVSREGSWLETPKKGGKRKMEDEDLTDEKQGLRMLELPAKKLPKRSAKKVIKKEQTWSDNDTEGGSFDGNDEGEEPLSGFEDIDYTKAFTKKGGRKLEQSNDEDWES